ncbi:hypothetical protein BD626DRAFT_630487 [Schizophyllum amplum]|uniref:MYND-type domain-containing protein n=1 Tax=Schizophyllum amplum TaxID=97359 RepID=A0A550CDH5_9AGAR|nr:hypothetical protein BD626DRAFT_630487 [Auriculariopsis ampla]
MDEPTEWQARFLSAIGRYAGGPVPARFFRSSIVRETFARLEPSKIPKHPLAASDVQVIDEAMQAISAYSRLLEAAEKSDKSAKKDVYASFDNAWKWAIFILPSSGNLGDSKSLAVLSPAYEDGRIIVGSVPVYLSLRIFWMAALIRQEGRLACISQPDFIDAVLSIYTAPIPVSVSQVAFVAHVIVQGLARVLEDPLHSPRLLSEICEYDNRHPGTFLRALVDHLKTILACPFDEYVPSYLQLCRKLFACDTMVDNFCHTGGIDGVVSLLCMSVSKPRGSEPSCAYPIMTDWLSHLRCMTLSAATSTYVTECLDAGILMFLWDVMWDEDHAVRGADWTRSATTFAKTVLAPHLVSLDVLYTFNMHMVEQLGPGYDLQSITPLWPELNELCRLFEHNMDVLTRLRKELKSLRYCHNGMECPRSAETRFARKMCACGRAFYCSKECQKMHWHEHRALCRSADEVAHLKLENPPMMRMHLEHCLLKKLARKAVKTISNHPKLEAGQALLVRFADGMIPQLAMLEDPLPPSRLPRLYAQIRMGSKDIHGELLEELYKYKRKRDFPRFLRSPVVREIYLRLSPSRIPTHPLDASDAEVIEDALEALYEFSRLYDANDARGGMHMSLILQAFPGVWQWLVFLLPSSNNIRHTRNPKRDVLHIHKAYLDDDGTVEVGLHSTFLTFITFVHCTLFEEEGRTACLAQSNFFWALLDINFAPIHGTVPRDVALLSHRLSKELNDLRLDQRYSRHAISSLIAHDEENPGCLSRAMVERLAWLLDGPREDQKFIPVYIDLIHSLLSTNRAVVNFRRARGVTLVVTVLGKAVASPGVLEDRYGDLLKKFFMICLPRLLLSTNTNGQIIEALDADLLYIFGMLVTGLPGDRGAAEDYRELANMLIRIAFGPALLWPDVLRAFHRAVKRVVSSATRMNVLRPRWEELGLLYHRYHACYSILAAFRAGIKKLQYCHNAQCQSQDQRVHQVCSCSKAFYCSKACQRAHWHAEHRVQCSRGMVDDALKVATTTRSVKVGPDTVELESDMVPITYMERAFIRSCGTLETRPVDGLRCVHHIPDPAKGQVFLLDWNCGLVGAKIYGIDDWLPPPLENGLPMVRIYARISKGHAQTVVLLDSGCCAQEADQRQCRWRQGRGRGGLSNVPGGGTTSLEHLYIVFSRT